MSGSFPCITANLNLVALSGSVRVFRAMGGSEIDEARLETHLQSRGFMNSPGDASKGAAPGVRTPQYWGAGASVPDPVPTGDPGSFDAALAQLADRVRRFAPRLAAVS